MAHAHPRQPWLRLRYTHVMRVMMQVMMQVCVRFT